jgi:hypothetical protein
VVAAEAKLRSHEAVVGAEVGLAVRLLLEGCDDVEVLRLQALRRGEQLAVRTTGSRARARVHGHIRDWTKVSKIALLTRAMSIPGRNAIAGAAITASLILSAVSPAKRL